VIDLSKQFNYQIHFLSSFKHLESDFGKKGQEIKAVISCIPSSADFEIPIKSPILFNCSYGDSKLKSTINGL